MMRMENIKKTQKNSGVIDAELQNVGKRVAMMTLGCKTNIVESEAILGALADAGCGIVEFDDLADYYIINTCTVTHISDRKSRQMIRRARKMSADAKIICMGCYSQLHYDEVSQMGVDLIVGNGNKNIVIDYILRGFGNCATAPDLSAKAVISDKESAASLKKIVSGTHSGTIEGSPFIIIDSLNNFEDIPEYTVSQHTRAFIKIQDGCDRYCTYCIIPYARGGLRSRGLESIAEEVRRLSHAGYTEFVLTGIHIASYGKESGFEHSLLDVIELINSIDGVRRIRLGSLEPAFIDEAALIRMAACGKLCDHFHLSLQSGSDKVLRLMNRRYSADGFIEAVERLRRFYANPSVTTDIIVGFPGEGEAEFRETVELVKKVRFSDIHIFPYSERSGTPAVRFGEKVPDSEKKRRLHELETVAAQLRDEYVASSPNGTVLVEVIENGVAGGYTSNYIYRKLSAENLAVGDYAEYCDRC